MTKWTPDQPNDIDTQKLGNIALGET